MLDATPEAPKDKKTRLHEGPDGRPRAGRGVGADLRRGLAPLPRLLLRREHARLRLEGDRRALPRAAAVRRAPLRPELRPRRDGRRAERRPRLHRGRRRRAPGAAAGRPARRALRARREGAAATASRRSSAGRTTRRATARRSPRSASTRGSATTCWPSTARSWRRTTTRTGCCAQDRPGHPHAEREARRSRARARSTYRPIDERGAAPLPRLGERQPRSAWTKLDGGRVGLPPHPRHGRAGHPRVHQVVLPADPQGGPRRRRALNGGGNVSQWIIERLDTKLLGTRLRRWRAAGDLSRHVFHGHMVALLNETSASDGDIFPHMFQQGGPRAAHRQADVGRRRRHLRPRPAARRRQRLRPASRATNDVDGSYIIEGHGVDPDIEVENDPASVIAGRRPAARAGRAGGREDDRGGADAAAEAAGGPGEDEVGDDPGRCEPPRRSSGACRPRSPAAS